jgi:hypothetical protein
MYILSFCAETCATPQNKIRQILIFSNIPDKVSNITYFVDTL